MSAITNTATAVPTPAAAPQKDMAKRALIIIDVQNEYFTGTLRVSHPPPEASLPCVLAAMDAATKAGVLVITVQHACPAGEPLFAVDTVNFDLHPAVAARPAALNVVKPMPSCFSGPALAAFLEAEGVGTLTLAGYMTHTCVDSTARAAAHSGYAVEVLADACSCVPYVTKAGAASAADLHNSTLTVLSSYFANVVPTAEWIAAIEGGAPLSAPDNIFTAHAAAMAKGLQ